MIRMTDIQAVDMHCRDLQRDAEIDRLARQIVRPEIHRQPTLGKLLYYFGHRLEAWGKRLQVRFDFEENLPSIQPSGIKRPV
ncbi:MAG: hypothetical protein M1281_17725 [Chloroflexi bacterium]|nr:hypothetical protein [Chloroflexota bacterium]